MDVLGMKRWLLDAESVVQYFRNGDEEFDERALDDFKQKIEGLRNQFMVLLSGVELHDALVYVIPNKTAVERTHAQLVFQANTSDSVSSEEFRKKMEKGFCEHFDSFDALYLRDSLFWRARLQQVLNEDEISVINNYSAIIEDMSMFIAVFYHFKRLIGS